MENAIIKAIIGLLSLMWGICVFLYRDLCKKVDGKVDSMLFNETIKRIDDKLKDIKIALTEQQTTSNEQAKLLAEVHSSLLWLIKNGKGK